MRPPYLGETAILWQLTETPAEGVEITRGGRWPAAIYAGFALAFVVTLLVSAGAYWRIRRWRRRRDSAKAPGGPLQCALWVAAIVSALVLLLTGWAPYGILALLAAQFLPISRRRRESSSPRPA